MALIQQTSRNTGSATSVVIPEVTSDPITPTINSTWVLSIPVGAPVGLLLTITNPKSSYLLSFKTASGIIVRTELK